MLTFHWETIRVDHPHQWGWLCGARPIEGGWYSLRTIYPRTTPTHVPVPRIDGEHKSLSYIWR